jgi:AcrR family transcriptional regulator
MVVVDPKAVTEHRVRLTKDERREAILTSARAAFSRAGYAGTRTRDIAREAGINEALLYHHFSSKEELFEASVTQPLEDAVSAVFLAAAVPPEEFSSDASVQRVQIQQFVSDLIGAMDEIAPLLGIVLFADADIARRSFNERIQPCIDKVCELVEINYDSWPHRDFEPLLMIEWIMGMTWFVALADRFSGRQRDRTELATQVTDVLMYGVALPAELPDRDPESQGPHRRSGMSKG